MQKLKLALAVSWFAVTAMVAGIFWLMALPFHFWQPVFEKAFDRVDLHLETRP